MPVRAIKGVFKHVKPCRPSIIAQPKDPSPPAMSALSAFLASFALAWTPQPAANANDVGTATEAAVPQLDPDDPMAVWQRLAQGFLPGEAGQVRIEQHIIWRITPMPGPARESMMAIAPTAPSAPRMIERKMSDCVPMSWIAGGQPQGNSRLLLFLRDRRLVAANLEKACSARDFYSGFYVDKPNADGRLCADRDRILSRSGARCQISSFRLLVADD